MKMKTLVAYFSPTGTTAAVAERLAEAVGADIFEIEPKKHYTEEDLNWWDSESRSSKEMKDPSSRPETSCVRDNMADYDVIALGFPIWWGKAPTIVNTFLEEHDFTGKAIVPFATSGGSGYGNTNASLAESCKGAELKEGIIFPYDVSMDELRGWFDEKKK